jgi:pyruvate/2-oxoglutarate dehydrogenase complex dihydrolipoamide dehydrogenase (E3) component
MARRAGDYGVEAPGPVAVDMKRVKARKDDLVNRGRNGIRSWMEGLANVTVFHGHARFEGPHRVRVGDALLEAERIFINTGGRAIVPDMPGLEGIDCLTNTSILDLDTLPRHLIVVGGSYIGLEFAQVYRRFGAEVTVVEMADRLIPREDPDVSAAVHAILAGEGIDIRLGARCLAAEKAKAGIAVHVDCREGGPTVEGSHLLFAVGRRPNTDDLGLDKAGVETDERGYIRVDEQCRTNVVGIWALGDVNGRGAFTHTSYNDYEIVAANLFDGDSRRISDRVACYGLFIDPPLGRVGMTETEVKAKGIAALVGRRDMSTVGRAREKGETLGFMKVVVEAESRRILGAAVLGLSGDEVVHAFLDVMAAGAPYTAISRTMHIHPTVSEYLPTLLGDLEPLS